MSQIRINSHVINGDVFVRCGDIIKSLYSDLAEVTDEGMKTYIRAQIDWWNEYEEGILKQAKERRK